VDFYCAEATLVLELDGESHLTSVASDRVRQRYLERHGLKVLRFWNTEVFDDLDAVLEAIWNECERRAGNASKSLTAPAPHPQPLSPEGRGEKR
jgi:very-short-patch-repair endonuclease